MGELSSPFFAVVGRDLGLWQIGRTAISCGLSPSPTSAPTLSAYYFPCFLDVKASSLGHVLQPGVPEFSLGSTHSSSLWHEVVPCSVPLLLEGVMRKDGRVSGKISLITGPWSHPLIKSVKLLNVCIFL